jgi:hypothetical protein
LGSSFRMYAAVSGRVVLNWPRVRTALTQLQFWSAILNSVVKL